MPQDQLPAVDSAANDQLMRFLKYVAWKAAVDKDVREDLVGKTEMMPTTPGQPKKLTGFPPEPNKLRDQLNALFAAFKVAPPTPDFPHDGVHTTLIAADIWEYGLGLVDFVQTRAGGSYLVNAQGRFRVLITPAQKPIVYRVGVGGVASTPPSVVDLDGCD